MAMPQLAKVANRCEVNRGRLKKEALVEVIADCRRFSIASMLDSLKLQELRNLAAKLGVSISGKNRDELIAEISGDQRRDMRARILKSLRRQGFQVRKGRLSLPEEIDKDWLRQLHAEAVDHKREKARESLGRKEPALLNWIADGKEVDPCAISPALVEVLPGSIEELLFRYACLHWSIPVSSGYGRRLRYVVVDQSNNKLIGLIGLGDPVFALAPRDNWIGWNSEQRRKGLHHVIDAFVLGAVPPYSYLLCGKLIAMLAACREVTARFQEKYGGQQALISQTERSGEVALITTTSALGRSSLYNRLTFRSDKMFEPVGFTRGSGEFQFLNGLYDEMNEFATKKLVPTAKNELWGSGFRNRREVVKKCIQAAGLQQDLLYHGVQREVFVVPTARNTCEYLRGEDMEIDFFERSAEDVFKWFRERWLMDRSERMSTYREFTRSSYTLWPE